jgi:hypothetical protein
MPVSICRLDSLYAMHTVVDYHDKYLSIIDILAMVVDLIMRY